MRRPPPWISRPEPTLGRPFSAESFVAAPVLHRRPEPDEPNHRSKIWDFNTNLHCSIIGTCLTTADLRQILGKLGLTGGDATDHDLHGTAVCLASRHDPSAKLLNKALDQRHRLFINRFARVRSEDEVRALWREAVAAGDIPGAYWATLTHPATGQVLIREAFGEVHMLSHLVGAANRADIRRLRALETEQAALQAALDRQQAAFRNAVVAREKLIAELEQGFLNATRGDAGPDARLLSQTVTTLEARLAAEIGRRVAAEERLGRLRATLEQERAARQRAQAEAGALAAELQALEASADPGQRADEAPSALPRRDGETLLYVGGRASQIAHLRRTVERLGAAFLHHDGGKEQHTDLLAGLISRADLVLFPVNCISHEAVLTIKRLCRQGGKTYLPLRAASLASLLLALQRVGSPLRLPEAAD